MAVNLGGNFEAEVAELAGLQVFDPGSLDIAFLNPTGKTTVRFITAVDVDSDALKAILGKYTT